MPEIKTNVTTNAICYVLKLNLINLYLNQPCLIEDSICNIDKQNKLFMEKLNANLFRYSANINGNVLSNLMKNKIS